MSDTIECFLEIDDVYERAPPGVPTMVVIFPENSVGNFPELFRTLSDSGCIN